MSLTKDYREHPKCRCGPGGITCACCSPMGCHPRKSKPLMRRIVRRTKKHNIRHETQDD